VKPAGLPGPPGRALLSRLPDLARRELSTLDVPAFGSSVALIAGRVVSMGLGFLAWVVAARLFTTEQVGLASGTVAAMMLCVQIAMAGIGSAVIALLPRYRGEPAALLNSSFTSVTAMAVLTSLAFLLLARGAFGELNLVATVPFLAATFVAMTVFGSVNVLFDNLSVAQRRGDQVLNRNIAFGLVTIAVPMAFASVFLGYGAWLVLAAWAAAGLTACAIGAVQTRRSLAGYRFKAQLDVHLVQGLVGVGLPNWALTLTERGPALLMPVLVTELISPTANAFWYAAWMMAWVVMIIPISVGQTLFAEAVREPEHIARATRHGLLTSLGLGLAAAAGMALLARVALGLLGGDYADAGEWALRVLVISVVPFSLTQAYYAVCRARGRLAEAIEAGFVFGMAAVLAAIGAGLSGGLTPMATAWLVVQLVAGAWAALRLRTFIHAGPPQ
jgi:O-antigen/teichoic acid export membrane protein